MPIERTPPLVVCLTLLSLIWGRLEESSPRVFRKSCITLLHLLHSIECGEAFLLFEARDDLEGLVHLFELIQCRSDHVLTQLLTHLIIAAALPLLEALPHPRLLRDANRVGGQVRTVR